mmetsp:Transcript_7897/g.18628  ORF Transcript_7897/g.18628 Transcript_7897/m.18628 type:complete len:262 (-) Transcript_7897:104-889(-)
MQCRLGSRLPALGAIRGGRAERLRRESNASRRRVDRGPDVGADRVEAAHTIHQHHLEDGGDKDRGEVAEALHGGVALRLRNEVGADGDEAALDELAHGLARLVELRLGLVQIVDSVPCEGAGEAVGDQEGAESPRREVAGLHRPLEDKRQDRPGEKRVARHVENLAHLIREGVEGGRQCDEEELGLDQEDGRRALNAEVHLREHLRRRRQRVGELILVHHLLGVHVADAGREGRQGGDNLDRVIGGDAATAQLQCGPDPGG